MHCSWIVFVFAMCLQVFDWIGHQLKMYIHYTGRLVMLNVFVQLNHTTQNRKCLKKIKSVFECFDILCGSILWAFVFTTSKVTPCSSGHTVSSIFGIHVQCTIVFISILREYRRYRQPPCHAMTTHKGFFLE